MAEKQAKYRPHGQAAPQQQCTGEGLKDFVDKGASSSQVMAVATLFPIGGTLFTLSGLTLVGTVIGLVLVTPLFAIFSPVLVPAAGMMRVALLGFLAAGSLGVGALSPFLWIAKCMRQKGPEHAELARGHGLEAAGYVG